MKNTGGLNEILNFDALANAEKITGKSYKEDKLTEAKGFVDFLKNNRLKENLLSSMDDTCFCETEQSYIRKVTDFGFKSLLVEPFINEDGIEERLHIMWHYDYSILLVLDTYTYSDDGSWGKAGKEVPPPSRNGGKLYYNWSPKYKKSRYSLTSSGGFVYNGDTGISFGAEFNKDLTPHLLPRELRDIEPKWKDQPYEQFKVEYKEWVEKVESYLSDKDIIYIWSGDYDCREALKHHINQLSENGTFLKQWKECPFIWLIHYMDTKEDGYDYVSINKERLSKLPIEIQGAINYLK